MASGDNSGVTRGNQMSLDQQEAEQIANENAQRVAGFNSAGSKSVGKVDSIVRLYDTHSIPRTGEPNSVVQNYNEGTLTTERYFNSDGNPYLDIDYTNHGNPKMHPIVPHEHYIDTSHGFKREKKGRAINK